MTSQQNFRWDIILPQGYGGEDAAMIASAVAAFFVAWAIGHSLFERDRMAPRLRGIHERRRELQSAYAAPRRRRNAAKDMGCRKKIAERFKPSEGDAAERLNMRLIQAGCRSKDAAAIHAFAKTALPLLGLVLGFMISGMNFHAAFAAEEIWRWLVVIGLAYVGARLPDILLANRRQKRYSAIRKALADTLDLMLICAEAGLSLGAALDRVAKELGHAYPEMTEELGLTSVELGFLPERSLALRHLAARVDLQEIRSMVNVLQQTEKYGTPVAQALRVLAREFRTERMLRAEQKAARLPALMTVPMIVFILPTLFVVIMTPAILSVMDNWIK